MSYLISPGGHGLWLLLLGIVVLVGVTELGFRLGKRSRGETLEAKKSQADVIVAALLALLGLLLAFSFNIVENRFARRKALVLDDANAIGTTYLRAGMMPAPYDARLQSLLREYVDYRLRISTPEEVERAIIASGKLQDEMWTDATALARAYPESEIVGLFVASLNNMIDLHQARVTVSLYQRLPGPIVTMLFVVALLAVGMVGFRMGLDRARSQVAAAMLVVAIMVVLALILDLDRPYSRMFRVGQRAMQDLHTMMSQPSTAARQLPTPSGSPVTAGPPSTR